MPMPAERGRLDGTGHKWLGFALVVLGAGAASVALLGPLVAGAIDYHASEGAVNQIVGGDVAGLLLVAPVSIVAGILAMRGHTAGPVLALGPAVYALYMYPQLALGGDFLRYPGNSERFFLLFLGLFVLAAAIAVRAWTAVAPDRLPAGTGRVDLIFGWFAVIVAAFLAIGLHLPGLTDVLLSDQPTGTEYLADPTVFWLVKFMDLGLVVPALATIGVGILKGRSWAHKAKYAAVGWVALLGASVAGMAIVMQLTQDPAAATANTIAFGAFALVALGLALRLYLPLFSASGTKAA